MPLIVRNPATGETIGEISAATRDEVRRAVARARAAQAAWETRGLDERARILKRFQQALIDAREEVAAIITRETGKPYAEALGADVLNLLEATKWATTKGVRHLRPTRTRLGNPLFLGRVSHFERAPKGVVGIVSPWNYPLAIPGGNVVYALVAGNTVVLKPASLTPFTALKLHELLVASGVPEDVFLVVPGSGSEAGQALIESDIDHVIFTGSVPVGLKVDETLRARGITTCMELGGSDPAIVLADAPLDHAVRGIAWARFTNAGQTCAAVKRCYVHRDVYDAFVAAMVKHVTALRLGDPMNPHIDLGPLTDPRSVDDMQAFVEDARKRDARVLCGGRARPDLGPQYFEPTVIVDLHPQSRLLTDECFGPILPIVPFSDVDDAIRMANASRFGLCASVWTNDVDKGRAVAKRLDAGTVVVNDAAYTFAANETPWGGIKDSGHGRTHGPWGLDDVTTLHHVNVVPTARPSAWWFPYSPGLRDTFLSGAKFLYGPAADKAKVGAGLVSNLLRRVRK